MPALRVQIPQVLFPLRGYCFWAAQPLRESYYMFDFCWIANFTGAIVMLLCVVDKVAYPGEEVISDRVREKLFCIVWTVGCLAWTLIVDASAYSEYA